MPIVDGKLKLTKDATTLDTIIDAVGGGGGDSTKSLRGDLSWGEGTVAYGTTAGTACQGNDARIPSSGEKAALSGTTGTPGSDNKYVTGTDGRLADNRSPTSHELTHRHGAGDEISVLNIGGYTTGTTRFLREDGTYQEPAGGSTVINSSAALGITIGKTGSGAAYICNGSNDTTQIQAAFNSAVDGSCIIFLPGAYYISEGITASEKNLVVMGVGKVTCTYTGTGSLCFSFQGASVLNTSLTANSNKGVDTITLTSVAGIQAGDLIIVSNNVDWTAYYSGFKTGEMYEVKSVNTGTKVVTLEEPLLRAYTTAANSIVNVFRPVKILWDNINVVGSGKTASMRGLVLDRTKGSIIQNCTFRDCGMAGIWQYLSYDTKYDKITVTDSQLNGYGYGIAITTASAKTTVSKCNLHGCRHTITIGTNLAYNGLCRDIIIDSSDHYCSTSGEPAVDAHAAAIDMTVNNNIFYSVNGIACQSGAQHTVFVGNDVRSGNGFSFRDTLYVPRSCLVSDNFVAAGYLFEDTDITDFDEISITDNVCVGSTPNDGAIFIAPGACTIKRLKIADNTIVDAVHGISLQMPDLEIGVIADIHGNTIKECTHTGMTVRLNTSNTNTTSIQLNVIKDFNTSNSTYAGILLTTVYYALVNGNSIFDLNGNNGNAIYSYSNCNNNTYIGNVAKGMTGTKFSFNETTKTNEHNISL